MSSFLTTMENIMNKLLFALPCLFAFQMQASGEELQKIKIEIAIECPRSEEFDAFVKSIPQFGNYSVSLDEWKSSFTQNMTQLLHLVENEKISNSNWSVHLDDEFAK
jgi:hypothetical protein